MYYKENYIEWTDQTWYQVVLTYEKNDFYTDFQF